jgi:hypothetical protein
MIIPSPSNMPELPQQHRTAALIVDMLTHRNIRETSAELSPSGNARTMLWLLWRASLQ